MSENLADTKDVIRSHKSKDRQYRERMKRETVHKSLHRKHETERLNKTDFTTNQG
jgi:hypothetical protein